MHDKKFDLRKYSRQTTVRLITGGILLLLIIGISLIYAFYGAGAAGLGLLCVLGGLSLVAIVLILLWLMEWIVRRNRNS